MRWSSAEAVAPVTNTGVDMIGHPSFNIGFNSGSGAQGLPPTPCTRRQRKNGIPVPPVN